FDAFVHSFLYDESNPNSVRSAMDYAFNNAVILRPELSSRVLQYVELALSSITDASERSSEAEDLYDQRDVTDDMLAFWGAVENSVVDQTLKSFLFVGKYLERLDLYTRLHVSPTELKPPLRKLVDYA
ncbi:alpha-E domain-containing protein, partial [Bifidobacterium saimiriisciurei]